MADEATLVVIKPDIIKRGLMGAVMTRLEALQLEIIGAKALRVSKELAERHYDHIREKPFFRETIDYMEGKLHGTSFVLAFVFWGPDAVERVRELTGATNPEKAEPTSIRGALGRMTTAGVMENALHTSADVQDAQREIALWFTPQELLQPLRHSSEPVKMRRR